MGRAKASEGKDGKFRYEDGRRGDGGTKPIGQRTKWKKQI
jgi:hypothetical protein